MTKLKLAITICATQGYAYAMKSQARLVAANVGDWQGEGLIILATDGSDALKDVLAYYQNILPQGWVFRHHVIKGLGEHENYKPSAQMVIARLRTAAFLEARRWQADLCWSLDSDVLPPSNAFRCMHHMLSFDGGYYSVSTCSYPNESFLGGFGSETHPIAEDFLPSERQLSERLDGLYAKLAERKASAQDPQARRRCMAIEARLARWAKAYPPKGDVFALNANGGWRRRGWLDNAYPAIGKGAVVPSDWCGFGCTLLNREALANAHFEGYAGHGTEDLWCVWKRWHQVGLRINCITHVVCDHVIHEKKKGGESGQYTHIRSYHETAGEFRGHIRTEKVPWLYD